LLLGLNISTFHVLKFKLRVTTLTYIGYPLIPVIVPLPI